MAPKRSVSEPLAARSACEIAESIRLVRQLVQVADIQIDRAKKDLQLARTGLAELEAELTGGVN